MKNTLIFVTSDIHGSEEILEDLVGRAAKLEADRFLIAGDLCPKGPAIPILLQNAPFTVVTVKAIATGCGTSRMQSCQYQKNACILRWMIKDT